jgi:general secretion pathway protein K
MLALLALVIAGFTLTSRSDIQLARNQTEAARARELADAGVTRAIMALSQPDPAHRWIADGRSYVWHFGNGEIVLSLQDENGKISVTMAPQEMLQSAFAYAGANDNTATALARAVLDRRRPNLDQAADHPASTPAFSIIEDLQKLPAMTPRIYYRTAPLMTVYNQSAGIDPNTASRDVLLALPNADPNDIDSFLAARAAQSEGGLPPTPPLSLGRYFAPAQSGTITIRARATTDTGAVFVRQATVSLRGDGSQPLVVQAWRQELTIP